MLTCYKKNHCLTFDAEYRGKFHYSNKSNAKQASIDPNEERKLMIARIQGNGLIY